MDSLLSIISSQRERFRARNQELEAVSRVPPSATLHGPEDRAEDTQVSGRKTTDLSGVMFVLCGQGGLPRAGEVTLGFERRIRPSR